MHHPSQDSTYHSLCYTSRGALAGTRNSSMGPPHASSTALMALNAYIRFSVNSLEALRDFVRNVIRCLFSILLKGGNTYFLY